MNIGMATTPETTRPISVWRDEAVITERETGNKLRVVRGDSSGSDDPIQSVAQDVEEMSVEKFEEFWL